MNSQVRQRLQAQAQEMGVKMGSNLKWNDKDGYHIKGYPEYKKGLNKAVDKGIKEGNLVAKVKGRMKRVNEAIDGKQKK